MSVLAVHPLEQLVLAEEAEDGPVAAVEAPVGTAAPHDGEVGGEPSLDALVSGMWEGLAARRPVACPLCGDEVVPLFGAHHHPVAGRCRGCGTTLD